MLLAFVSLNQFAGANVTTQQSSTLGQYKEYTFFATSTVQVVLATTTNATSTNITPWFDTNGERDAGYFVVAGAKQVSFHFIRGDKLGGGNTGSTNFRVQYTTKSSPTESDWFYYNKLVQNLATSTAITTLSSITASAGTSTTFASLQVDADAVYAVRCIAIETTDGSHECAATAAW